ncbi:MAG TPA: folylpolyglutamate synthase/dihydrofolate synthase family protein [Syntrophomonas sp.]|nr:folylpolyglutamate synthase/dihydrofolate synthase family protein [Syntrophomonas sp.]
MIEEKLRRISAPGSKPGLDRILELLAELDDPQLHLPAVHVTGTNGKGSTSLMIAEIMSAAGYKVGRFSSPHLHSYTERFIVDGEAINPETLLYYLDQIEMRLSSWQGNDYPTEFEILTAVAFLYFRDEQVDLAVLEVGMGGLYDSTNVIIPLVSVITGVALDHTEVLGNTLEEIAYNKAGIIKAGVPVVVGPVPEPAEGVIALQTEKLQAPLVKAESVRITRSQAPTLQGQIIDLGSARFILKNQLFTLLGDYQLDNLACAVATVEALMNQGFAVSQEDLSRILPRLRFPGRMEVLRSRPLVIGDVAHNPQGAEVLSASLQQLLPDRERILVCGMLDDKERAASLQYLGRHSSSVVFTRPLLGERSGQWRETSIIWRKLFPGKAGYEIENITAAVQKGLELLTGDQYLLITGSFYVLEEAREFFMNI